MQTRKRDRDGPGPVVGAAAIDAKVSFVPSRMRRIESGRPNTHS